MDAGKAGEIGTYIVFPSGLYGEGVGPTNPLRVIQLIFREKAKELGFVPYVGDGSSTFNSLHVKAVTPFMMLVLDLALREEIPQESVYERCFLIGRKELLWKVASNAFARALHAEGLASSPEAQSVTQEGAGQGELPMLMASNMRFVSPRAEKLGYKNEEMDLVECLGQAN